MKNLSRKSFEKDHIFYLGYAKIAEMLIQNGADVDIRGPEGETALIRAIHTGKFSQNFRLQ